MFIDQGIVISDHLCKVWFQIHERKATKSQHSQSLINIVGDTAIALMGLHGLHRDALSTTAAALGLTNGVMDNYRMHFLFL